MSGAMRTSRLSWGFYQAPRTNIHGIRGVSRQIKIPSYLPECYFERLDIYAPHIRMIGFPCAWLVPKDYSRHVISWPAIALRTDNLALPPNLKAISLEGKGSFSHQLYVALDWVDALVLLGVNLVQCNFDLKLDGIDPAAKDKAQRILRQILSQSPNLEYLSLHSHNAWEVASLSGTDHFPFQDTIPRFLTYLAATSELPTSSSLAWIAKLAKLSRWLLSSPGHTPQHIVDCSLAVFPTKSLRLVSLRSPYLTGLELGIRIVSEIDPHVLALL
ncbi:hypothetical protein RhiJN_00033 [Ceratobasidium sp. AG-Ba]|nr:hypothetical protein RhiJN_00033 [Ceratobasidium sp. AG-Ba]QRW01074.1 hypothetical protein RhiLY_00071 [Ceratobasidium sp. AG-Ba]